MSARIDEAKNDADRFASMVLHYSHNAERCLESKDYQKASEMMWGAMSCVIKAVAAKEDISIKSHKALAAYTRKFAKRQKNKEIFNSFAKAGTLHSNFYESNLDPETILAVTKDVSRTVGVLMRKMGYRAP